MFNSANQEQIELQNEPVLRLIKNEGGSPKKDFFLYYNSGVFPILMIVIFFMCVGVIINIGLRIQNMNYDKKIYSISQLISSEKERSDRLNLKISELKSPSRIAGGVFSDRAGSSNASENSADTGKNAAGKAVLEGRTEENYIKLKNLDIVYSKTANDTVVSELEAANSNNQYFKGVNFVLMVKNIKDVLMVVSEGILTFFIP